MNDPVTCLTPELLRQLAHDEVEPQRWSEWEEHLSHCTRCQSALEQFSGDAPWLAEVREALTTELMLPSGDASSVRELLVETDDTLPAVIAMLGPTDDPRMLGRIGPYEIVGVLGRGGMGVVFKGFDTALNRYVAIKMLLPHLALSGAARRRFAREAQAAAAVVNDHVMAIHSVAEWQGMPYLVMPYGRGVSLQRRLNDHGALDATEVLRIGMQTARGLAAAHAQGLIHRDVKPANILLADGVDRVTLTDFGLARAIDDATLTRQGTLAGTPQYMSPEQARGQMLDARSDLFSLGCVLYAMCTGLPPFRAESSYGVLRQVTDEQPRPIRELNPAIPEWLERIIVKLLEKEPQRRFASATELADLLEQCLAHLQQPLTCPLPVGELFEPRVRMRRRPTSARWSPRRILVASGAVLASLLVVVALWQQLPPPRSNTATSGPSGATSAKINTARGDDDAQKTESDAATPASVSAPSVTAPEPSPWLEWDAIQRGIDHVTQQIEKLETDTRYATDSSPNP